MVNLNDIAGYALDGAAYCLDCYADVAGHGTPFFCGDEFDYAPTCDKCGHEITDVNVINVEG
jgi:hypothetical protein